MLGAFVLAIPSLYESLVVGDGFDRTLRIYRRLDVIAYWGLVAVAAFAIVTMFYVFHMGQSWWGALPEVQPLWLQAALLITGLYIADRVNKMPLVRDLELEPMVSGYSTSLSLFKN